MRRGDVFGLRMPKSVGQEQQAPRLGVVVQDDAMLVRSVVLIAPTSLSARTASFRPEVEVAGTRSKVLVEQMGAIDVSRLGDLVGRLTAEEIWGVDEALRTVLELH